MVLTDEEKRVVERLREHNRRQAVRAEAEMLRRRAAELDTEINRLELAERTHCCVCHKAWEEAPRLATSAVCNACYHADPE